MIKEAGEPTDLFYCEFIKWDVRDDCTRGVSATPMTALKKAIYLFDNWLNFALNPYKNHLHNTHTYYI